MGWDGKSSAPCVSSVLACSPCPQWLVLPTPAVPLCSSQLLCLLFVLCLTEGSVLPLGSREAWEEQVSFLCPGWPGSPCRNT